MPELRRDPLGGRWVIIATERAKRPSDFAGTAEPNDTQEDCPFCEGHESETPPEIFGVRPNGSKANAPGWRVRVVPSIKPILRIEGELSRRGKGIYDVMQGVGAHEVLVEDPQHVANLADCSTDQIACVLKAATQRIQDLRRDPRFRYVLWFKNYGVVAGAGQIRHTRSQLIATPVTPKRVKEELAGALRYFQDKDRCLLCDLLRQELELRDRVVLESNAFVVLCPFASRFPFELSLFPKRHACDFASLSPEATLELAEVLKRLLTGLREILADPPYNYVLHTAPFRHQQARAMHWKSIEEDYHWHLELIPRLTRVAGFEWGSGFYINPTPPEEAARHLREAVQVKGVVGHV